MISGDLAYSGRREEYVSVEQFLNDLLMTTNHPKSRLLPVPGNHDTARSAISPLAVTAVEGLNSEKSVNHFLENESDRLLVFPRFYGYQSFVNQYFGSEYLQFDHANYFYVKELEIANKKLAILGLNSAWLSASDKDYRQLILGERQVRSALDKSKSADLRLAVVHHPFDWLKDFDRENVEPLLTNNCDFILHGHMHQVGLLQTPTVRKAVVISAGACYETLEHPNSYNFVHLDLGTGIGEVNLRMYSKMRGGFWTKDVLNYQDVDGVHSVPPAKAPACFIRSTNKGSTTCDISCGRNNP